MKPKRILQCIMSMGGGGAERQLAYLAEGLTKRGLEVHVAICSGGPNLERLTASGAVVHWLCNQGRFYPGIFLRLAHVIKQTKPDLIQTWLHQMDILGGIASTVTGIPFIVSERCSPSAYPGGRWDRLRLMSTKKAIAVVANSEEGKEYWIEQGKNPYSIIVIRNGIPFEEIGRVSGNRLEDFEISPECELIVFAGRYCVQKNLKNLMAMLLILLKARPQARSLFFGDGPQRGELLSLHRQYGFGDRLKIMGFTDRLWNVLKRANLFVSVSHFEGQPNVVLEAVACRCPVLVSDILEHREFLDPDCAYFVPQFSPEAMARTAIEALDSVDERRRRAENAYTKLSRWSVDSVAQEYFDFYEEILGKENPQEDSLSTKHVSQ